MGRIDFDRVVFFFIFLADDSVVVDDNGDDDESSDDEAYGSAVQNPLESSISKATHIRFMKIAFNSAGIFVTRKVTHVPRSSAAKVG